MFLRVLLATSILSSEMVASGNIRSNTMYKKTLSNKDALCNDGTTAIYYMDVQEPSQWIIFLESGAYWERVNERSNDIQVHAKHNQWEGLALNNSKRE